MSAVTSLVPSRLAHGGSWWRAFGFTLAVLLILALALSTVSDIAYFPIPSHQRIFAQHVTALNIQLDSGSITIERTSGHDIVVENSGARGLTTPTNHERVTGHILSIRSSCTPRIFNFCQRNYVIRVPNSVTITADTGQAGITVSGIDSSMSLETSQGDVSVVGAKGSVRVSTGQGEVMLSRIDASSVSASSGQGDVTVNFTSPPTSVTATSSQGGVTVGLPDGPATYHVKATSSQGSVTDTVNESPSSSRAIHASSGQGNVVVRYDSR